MQQVIDKQGALALRQQIRNLLAERIDMAYYKPGGRIDSIRKLSTEFDVSPVTVSEALRLLEADGYIVRIPANGIFVNEKFAVIQKPVNLVFAFPEKSLSPELLPAESWALSSEIFRGLLEGGREYGAKVHFEYFQDHSNDVQLHDQLKRLRQYDAAVFTGQQLLELQKLHAKVGPTFQIIGEARNPEWGLVGAGYSREPAMRILAHHLVGCGYRTAGVLSLVTDSGFYQLRASQFRQICGEAGLEVSDEFSWEFQNGAAGNFSLLRKKLSGKRPDVFFCNHAEFVKDIYGAAADCGLKIGRDMGMVGIATGWTFNGLIPSLTHVAVPQFRVAKKIVQETVNFFRHGKAVNPVRIDEFQLVLGGSTGKVLETNPGES